MDQAAIELAERVLDLSSAEAITRGAIVPTYYLRDAETGEIKITTLPTFNEKIKGAMSHQILHLVRSGQIALMIEVLGQKAGSKEMLTVNLESPEVSVMWAAEVTRDGDELKLGDWSKVKADVGKYDNQWKVSAS